MVRYLATLCSRNLDIFFRNIKVYDLWKPDKVEDEERNAVLQDKAKLRRELVTERLDRFRRFSGAVQGIDVGCPYCNMTPNREAHDRMDTEAKGRAWEQQHAADKHFTCRLCDAAEKKKEKADRNYKRRPAPKFVDIDAHIEHMNDKHKGQAALRWVDRSCPFVIW